MSDKNLKTRFAPSPTGYLHVGGARTALYNFLLARKTGGTFLLRIEDTDRARHDESAIPKIIDDLRWLGLAWDEGVDLDDGQIVDKGDAGPYRQSQRLDIYRRYVEQLLDDGKAYYAFETSDDLKAMRDAAAASKQNFRYPRPREFPTKDDADRARAAGRPVAVRFACPMREITIRDDAFGEVAMPQEEQSDFIIQKADGWPTYHLANVVDDALMGVNYICRGQEFLAQTWRHAALRDALGFESPRYCHLPLILDMQGRKLSKRDGAVEVHSFRKIGYLPEALANFIALLGWNPGGDREKMTLDEMTGLFGPERIGKSNAKFDRDKLLAFNTDAMADAGEQRLLAGLKDYLTLNPDVPIPQDDKILMQLIDANRNARTFADIADKCGVLFVPDDAYEYDPKAVKKILAKNDGAGYEVLRQLRDVLDECRWEPDKLKEAIEDFCRRRKLGMGKVAQPLRVAVTGTKVSPGIDRTLTILGREKTLARIDRCLKLQNAK